MIGPSQRLSKRDVASLVIPSTSYLYKLDADETHDIQSLKAEMKSHMTMYINLLCMDKTVEGCLASFCMHLCVEY